MGALTVPAGIVTVEGVGVNVIVAVGAMVGVDVSVGVGARVAVEVGGISVSVGFEKFKNEEFWHPAREMKKRITTLKVDDARSFIVPSNQ